MKCCGRAADPTAKLFQACKGRSNNEPVRRGGGGLCSNKPICSITAGSAPIFQPRGARALLMPSARDGHSPSACSEIRGLLR